MNADDGDLVLREWAGRRVDSLSAELQAVETALFLEDTFGIVVPDDLIDPRQLGDLEGMRAVLARHRDT